MRTTLLPVLALSLALAPVAPSLAGATTDAAEDKTPDTDDPLALPIPQATFADHWDHRAEDLTADELPEPVTGIRPGTPIEVSIGDAGSNRCTASWVMTDGASYYIGTAGHCVLPGNALSSQDDDFAGADILACVASCESETGDLDGATFVELGDVFYAQSAYLDNPAVSQGYDFAFVEVPVQHYDLAETSIAAWEGPTDAVDREEPHAGDIALQYGHGTAAGDAYPTEGRVGVFDGDGTTVTQECHHEGDGCVVHFTGAVTPGDSGSPIAVGSANGTHGLEAEAAAGITTDAAGYMTWGTIPFTPLGFPERAHTALGTHIQQAIHLTEQATQTQLSLVPSNESLPLPPPSKPLEADATNPGTGSDLDLEWAPPDPHTLPIESYQVYRSENSTSFEDKTQVATTAETTLDDQDVAEGATYCYQIQATDEDDQASPPSAETCATVEALAPPAPAARADNPGLGGELTVAWSEPEHVRAIDRYEVERSVDGGSFEHLATTSDRFLSDDGLDASSTYRYQVTAVDEDGLESAPAETEPLQPTPDPPEWSQAGHDAQATSFTGASGDVQQPSTSLVDLEGPAGEAPRVVDLDGSGHADIVTVTEATERGERLTVQALERTDSTWEPRWSVDLPHSLVLGLEPSSGTAQTAIANVDADPAEEVIAYTSYRVDPGGEALTQDGAIFVIDGATGSVEASYNGAIGFGTETAPRVGDVTSSPGPEIVIVDQGPELIVLGIEAGEVTLEAVGPAGQSEVDASPVLADVTPARSGMEVVLGTSTDQGGQLVQCEPLDGEADCAPFASIEPGVQGLAAAALEPVLTPSLIVHGDQEPGLAVRPTSPDGANASAEIGPAWNAPAVGPLGPDGRPAIVSGLADASPSDLEDQGDLVVHQHEDGTLEPFERVERPSSVGENREIVGQIVVDVNGDGALDVVAADRDGRVLAHTPASGAAGEHLWTVDLDRPVEHPPVLADVDGDDLGEVLLAAGDGVTVTGNAS